MKRPVSKCLSCGNRRPCVKIEARAPLRKSVLVYSAERRRHERVDYEPDGPMVEICHECLKTDIGTLAHYLQEQL